MNGATRISHGSHVSTSTSAQLIELGKLGPDADDFTHTELGKLGKPGKN